MKPSTDIFLPYYSFMFQENKDLDITKISLVCETDVHEEFTFKIELCKPKILFVYNIHASNK